MTGVIHTPTILLVCDGTVGQKHRSGIHRVVVELSRALARRCNLRLVRWDDRDGQLRDLDAIALERLFGDDIPDGLRPHPACQRVAFRFVDTIEDPGSTWLLYTEVPHEMAKGAQKMAAMRAQCREVGVRSAAIFYDLIPVLEEAYRGSAALHTEYMIETLLFDRIFSISSFARESLLDFVRDSAALDRPQFETLITRLRPLPLGEYREEEEWGIATHGSDSDENVESPRMIMVGTVEPRKQQVRLLKAINDARNQFPELNALSIDVFGSLHGDCADDMERELARNKRIAYHRYATDEQIERSFGSAWFSAFVSTHEGYGLPIVESLRHGVPCLTASFGAMSEVAGEGGCLLVDTRDDYDMVRGVRRLLTDSDLLETLREQVARRPKRSWGDYANDLLNELVHLVEADQAAESAFRQEVARAGDAPGQIVVACSLHGVDWTVTNGPGEAAKGTDRKSGEKASLLLLDSAASDKTIHSIAEADVIASLDPTYRRSIVDAASQAQIERLLTDSAYFGEGALDQAIEAAIAISRVRGGALAVRDETQMRCRLLKCFWEKLPHPEEKLAIVLSTYNRAGFVEHNVEWILGQIDRDKLPVRCVVVDNASTDDSFQRLQRFVGHPRFTLVENANNVGMLGNLRVCAAGLFAPYVWLTGDDDFIVEGRIAAVLDAIEASPGVPLMVHNFAVYHRAAFSPTDNATQFMREMQRLAPDPEDDSIRPINMVAGEHDNLFTAIYPLVFRSDVLAACFDHPFTETPFVDLTQSVPTTKLLLGTYRYASAAWFADVGIVGNAHNSWSRHRPRWHLVLMPKVLQLAREAGVAPGNVWNWIKIHKQLFDEAVDICLSKNDTAHLDLPGDILFAEWSFRQDINLDERLRLAETPVINRWSPMADRYAS